VAAGTAHRPRELRGAAKRPSLARGPLDSTGRLLNIVATLAYLLGVQLPTAAINVPLNNELQSLNVDAVNENTQQTARGTFEPRWNRWNAIRTAVASLVSAPLLILLFKL